MKQIDGGIELGGMRLMDSMLRLNPLARFFNKNRGQQNELDNERVFQSQALSDEQLMYGNSLYHQDNSAYPDGGVVTINVQFEQYFANKTSRIVKYREMSFYPEISNALDMITDEAIVEDDDGKIAYLELRKEVPEHIEEELRKIWDYVCNDLFSINETAWEMFNKWLIEGELYVELVLNDHGNNIIGTKILPSFTMYPIYRENQVIGYIQSINQHIINSSSLTNQVTIQPVAEDIMFDRDQIVYVNSGKFGANYYDIKGFLDGSIRTYNQLRQLEDATVVNKIVRAPMRRVFNVATGRMPKTRGEEYVKGQMMRHRKRVKYDPVTGAMDSSENFLAMIEDYWFAKPEGQEGTTVTNLEGSATFSDMEDVKFFLGKLYKTLRLPSSRWANVENPSMYSAGKSNEITREEIQFSNFISRLQNRFKYLLLDTYITLLRLRGFDDRYIDYSIYNVKFNQSNRFKQYKELEIMEARTNILTAMDPFVYKAGDNEGGYFDKEFVLKKYFLMSDEEFNENLYLLNKTKNLIEAGKAGGESSAQGGDKEVGASDIGGMAGGVGGGGSMDMGGDIGGEEEAGGEAEAGGDAIGAAMAGAEEEVPAESVSFSIKKTKPTSVLVEFVQMDKEIRENARKKFAALRDNLNK